MWPFPHYFQVLSHWASMLIDNDIHVLQKEMLVLSSNDSTEMTTLWHFIWSCCRCVNTIVWSNCVNYTNVGQLHYQVPKSPHKFNIS